MTASYVVISPVRNEAEYLESTITSVVEQSVSPQRWVIVDDGSSDATGTIADQWAARVPWISAVHRPDRGHRAAGSGVIEAFNEGLHLVEHEPWEYLVKLDGDLRFDPDYFESCLAEFAGDERLGIGGGVVFNATPTGLVREQHQDFHVRGATKIYRRECWDELGGLVATPGWDTIDEVKANMLGWTTRSFPDIHLTQLRPTGAAVGGWRNWVKNGEASHRAGYDPFYLTARAAALMVRRPYIIAGLGLGWGYVSAAIAGKPRAVDDDLLRYIRDQQRRRLLGQPTIWR